jgi:hypothetical protein
VAAAAEDSDEPIWSIRANHSQGFLARGGKLLLTDTQLIFQPHGFDSALGGSRWEISLRDIAAVEKAPRSFNPLGLVNGAVRRRLKVVPTEGEPDYFVVNLLDEVISDIKDGVSGIKEGAGAGPS